MAEPMDGECIKQDFDVINSTRNTQRQGRSPESDLLTCCGVCSNHVYIDVDFPDDPTRNDISGPHWFIDDPVSIVRMFIEKWENGNFTAIEEITDDTYGKAYLLGDFKNNIGQNFIGIQLDWRLVHAAFGYGSYRIKVGASSFIDSTVYLSNEYCFEAYSNEAVEETVKIEWFLNGILGVNTDDYLIRDYEEIDWYDSMRLPGVFWYLKSTYEKDYTRYNDGSRPWVLDEQEPDFTLELQQICWNFHELLRTDAAQSDLLLITDYNKNNVTEWTQKAVQLSSEYPPNWNILRNKLASVTLSFRQHVNNLKKRRC